MQISDTGFVRLSYFIARFVRLMDKFTHGFTVLSFVYLILFYFHVLSGIISRAYTEQLLSSKPIGSYLIRVSEKMFGYVLSYLASDHCRHLLIEVTQPEHAYRFLGGAKSELFGTLSQLIEKYTV